MTRGVDAIVIGAGVNGASIAFHLARRGLKVTVLEKNFVASGPTGKSSAIVRQHYSNLETARLARRSLEIFQNFREYTSGGDAGFVTTGAVFLAHPRDAAGVEANVQLQKSVGINTRAVTADELKALDPRLEVADLRVAAYEPESGYADPVATTTSFVQAAKDLGAELRQRTPVTALKVSRGKVIGVSTPEGDIATSLVISAAGPWTAALAAQVGAELPLIASRHQVATFKQPATFGAPHFVIGDFVQGYYCRPETGALTLVGSLSPEEARDRADPDHYNQGVDFEFIAHFGERVCRRIPLLEQGFSRGGWAGIYDIAPDWHHIIGPVGDAQGFYVCAGTSGHGFKLAPAVGEMVANAIVDNRWDGDIALFRPTRFQEGQPVRGRYSYSIIG